MLRARIGHTALTWDVFREPARLAEAIRDCAALGYAGTETGGRIYDWWEEHRPGELPRLLANYGVTLACLFHIGDWTEAAAGPALLDDSRRWAEAVARLGGDILMLVPGRRRDLPPYSLDEFQQMAETMNRAGELARAAGVTAAMHPHWGTVADPLPIIDRWAARVHHVHLKDLAADWEEKRRAGVPLRSPEGYAELGQGTIDFRPLVPILERVDYAGWLMVELDEASRPARDAAALSKQYLEQTLGLTLAGR